MEASRKLGGAEGGVEGEGGLAEARGLGLFGCARAREDFGDFGVSFTAIVAGLGLCTYVRLIDPICRGAGGVD